MSVYAMIPGEHQSKSMRNLIVDNVEKYRLEINHKLMYAKGKINFNLNLPKDGQGKRFYEHVPFGMPASCYAFYQDGFYYKNEYNNYYKYPHSELNFDFLANGKDTAPPPGQETNVDRYMNKSICDFIGWFTDINGGKQITNIKSLYDNTNLFQVKNNDILPEITLYAHWKVATCTVRIKNIKRTYYNYSNGKTYTGFSSFKVNGAIKTGNSNDSYQEHKNVLYNTLLSTLVSGISEIKYNTWCDHALDGTAQEQNLRNNPQQFLGWSDVDKATELLRTNYAITQQQNDNPYKIIYIYPQFTPIIILKHTKLPKGTYYVGKSTASNPLGKIKVQNVGGYYYLLFTGQNDSPYLHQLFNFRSYSNALLSYLGNKRKADVEYYYYDKSTTTDTYSWKLKAKDSNVSPNINDIFTKTPYSSTFVYAIDKL